MADTEILSAFCIMEIIGNYIIVINLYKAEHELIMKMHAVLHYL